MKLYLILLTIFFSQVSFGQDVSTEIIQSNGFTFESFFRGLIGMATLILISFLLSNNKKEINLSLIHI